MKYTKLFNSETDYNSYKNGEDFITPNVSYIKDKEKVEYTEYQPDAYVFETKNLSDVSDTNLTIDTLFKNCTSLVIPDGYTSYAIQNRTLKNTNIETITIPGTITTVTSSTAYNFQQVTKLKKIIFKEGVTGFGSASMFYGDSNLTKVVLPSTFTTLTSSSFQYCRGLTSVGAVGSGASVELPKSVTSIPTYAFSNCSGLTNVTIPDSVTSIGQYAFGDCTGFTSINIPNSVTTIGERAFRNCTSLTSVTILATTPPTLGAYVFDNTSNELIIYVPADSLQTYKTATNWSYYASKMQAII